MEKKRLPALLRHTFFTLRKHTPVAAYDMFAAIDSDRHRLCQFLPWVEHIKSVEDQLWYINECQKDWDEGKMFDFGIFTPKDEYVGNIGVHTIRWTADSCEIGYWITQPFEGRGFISQAVQLLEKELLNLGFNRIEIRCDPSNERSASVPRRNGYTFEGILREDTVFRGGYRDTAVYSKLKADLTR